MNEDNTAFLASQLIKMAKDLLKGHDAADYAEDSPEGKIITLMSLLDEEKELKKAIKTDSAKLHLLTKETIENLEDEQVNSLLELKWITPLIVELRKMPEVILDILAAKVQALADKYSITFADVEDKIEETEAMLSSMIEQLKGSDVDIKGLAELKILLGGE